MTVTRCRFVGLALTAFDVSTAARLHHDSCSLRGLCCSLEVRSLWTMMSLYRSLRQYFIVSGLLLRCVRKPVCHLAVYSICWSPRVQRKFKQKNEPTFPDHDKKNQLSENQSLICLIKIKTHYILRLLYYCWRCCFISLLVRQLVCPTRPLEYSNLPIYAVGAFPRWIKIVTLL